MINTKCNKKNIGVISRELNFNQKVRNTDHHMEYDDMKELYKIAKMNKNREKCKWLVENIGADTKRCALECSKHKETH